MEKKRQATIKVYALANVSALVNNTFAINALLAELTKLLNHLKTF